MRFLHAPDGVPTCPGHARGGLRLGNPPLVAPISTGHGDSLSPRTLVSAGQRRRRGAGRKNRLPLNPPPGRASRGHEGAPPTRRREAFHVKRIVHRARPSRHHSRCPSGVRAARLDTRPARRHSTARRLGTSVVAHGTRVIAAGTRALEPQGSRPCGDAGARHPTGPDSPCVARHPSPSRRPPDRSALVPPPTLTEPAHQPPEHPPEATSSLTSPGPVPGTGVQGTRPTAIQRRSLSPARPPAVRRRRRSRQLVGTGGPRHSATGRNGRRPGSLAGARRRTSSRRRPPRSARPAVPPSAISTPTRSCGPSLDNQHRPGGVRAAGEPGARPNSRRGRGDGRPRAGTGAERRGRRRHGRAGVLPAAAPAPALPRMSLIATATSPSSSFGCRSIALTHGADTDRASGAGHVLAPWRPHLEGRTGRPGDTRAAGRRSRDRPRGPDVRCHARRPSVAAPGPRGTTRFVTTPADRAPPMRGGVEDLRPAPVGRNPTPEDTTGPGDRPPGSRLRAPRKRRRRHCSPARTDQRLVDRPGLRSVKQRQNDRARACAQALRAVGASRWPDSLPAADSVPERPRPETSASPRTRARRPMRCGARAAIRRSSRPPDGAAHRRVTPT